LRLGVGLRGGGQLEGVAHVVGVLDHLIALVEVPEHHGAVAELGLRRPDPAVQLLGARLAVLLRDLALARGGGGGRVGHRGARAVAGVAGVDVPGGVEQLGGAGAAGGGTGRDVADGEVDRGGGGHGVLSGGWWGHWPVRGPLSARWMDRSWRSSRAGRWRPPVRKASVATSRPEASIW